MAPEPDPIVLATTPVQSATFESRLEEWPLRMVQDVPELYEVADAGVGAVVLAADFDDQSADDVLDGLRERSVYRPVVLLDDEDPDTDSLGSRFSARLDADPSEQVLQDTVERLASKPDEAVLKEEYLTLAATKAAMDLDLTPAERDESSEYAALTDRIELLRDYGEVAVEEFERAVAERPT